MLAFYWSLIVMMGNESYPIKPEDKVFSTCVILVGMLVNSVVIGSCASLLANMDQTAVQKQQQFDSINENLNYHKVSSELATRIRSYYDYLWACGHHTNEDALFRDLPEKIRMQLSMNKKKPLIRGVEIFQNVTPQCTVSIVEALVPVIMLPREYVMVQGQPGDEMFFINRGFVQVTQFINFQEAPIRQLTDGARRRPASHPRPRAPRRLLRLQGLTRRARAPLAAGGHFGEIALLNANGRRTANVVTISFCDLQMLDRKSFSRIQKEHDEFREQVKAYSDARAKTMARRRPPPLSGPRPAACPRPTPPRLASHLTAGEGATHAIRTRPYAPVRAPAAPAAAAAPGPAPLARPCLSRAGGVAQQADGQHAEEQVAPRARGCQAEIAAPPRLHKQGTRRWRAPLDRPGRGRYGTAATSRFASPPSQVVPTSTPMGKRRSSNTGAPGRPLPPPDRPAGCRCATSTHAPWACRGRRRRGVRLDQRGGGQAGDPQERGRGLCGGGHVHQQHEEGGGLARPAQGRGEPQVWGRPTRAHPTPPAHPRHDRRVDAPAAPRTLTPAVRGAHPAAGTRSTGRTPSRRTRRAVLLPTVPRPSRAPQGGQRRLRRLQRAVQGHGRWARWRRLGPEDPLHPGLRRAGGVRERPRR